MAAPPARTETRRIPADLRRSALDLRDLFAQGQGAQRRGALRLHVLADIKALPVADWAAPDCVLLLWATDPLLDKAMDVIRAWGFTYKTVGFCWAKLNKSTPFSS